MKENEHTALITGASAGIGAAFARHLAREGMSLLLVARRADRLEALASELVRDHGVRCETFAADLSEPGAPARIMDAAERMGLAIDVLVNNAGMSGKRAFAKTSWEKLSAELHVMVMALTELTHRALPAMRDKGWGRIINVSSIAALGPPGASLLYTGIKSYVLHMSQALDMELKPQGIHVTALCPGFTYTEFHDVMGTREAASGLPEILWQKPEEVVRAGWDAVSHGKPVCVPGAVNKVLVGSVRPLPLGLQYRMGRSMNPFKERR